MSSQSQQLNLWPAPLSARSLSGADSRPMWFSRYRAVLLASDAAMLLASCSIAYWIRFELQFTVAPEVVPSTYFYSRVVLLCLPLWLGLFILQGLYDEQNLLGGTKEYARAFNACTTSMMMVVLFSFLDPRFLIARGWLGSAWIASIVFVIGARFLLRRLVYRRWRQGHDLTSAIVIGWNGEALSLARQLIVCPRSGYRLLGVVTTGSGQLPGPLSIQGQTLDHLGCLGEISEILEEHPATELIVAASSLSRDQLLDLFRLIQPLPGVSIRLSTGLYEVLTTGVEVKNAADVPLIRLNRLRLSSSQWIMKSTTDYLIAASGLLVLSPLLLAIAVLIKRDSPGPVLYRRRVIGVGGHQFDAFKFRTMFAGGDHLVREGSELGRRLALEGKLKDDPRVSRIGRILRRYSLDELPQLINVLRGEMSLVGPRMITAPEAAHYGQHSINLMTVKPGITGLWQVSGRSDLSYQERVRLDMHYIRNYSIWLDAHILFLRTPATVLRGRGAY